jgi:hypothetical protein
MVQTSKKRRKRRCWRAGGLCPVNAADKRGLNVHLKAAGALHVHEVRVGLLDKLVELVELGLIGLRGVEEVVVNLRRYIWAGVGW